MNELLEHSYIAVELSGDQVVNNLLLQDKFQIFTIQMADLRRPGKLSQPYSASEKRLQHIVGPYR